MGAFVHAKFGEVVDGPINRVPIEGLEFLIELHFVFFQAGCIRVRIAGRWTIQLEESKELLGRWLIYRLL